MRNIPDILDIPEYFGLEYATVVGQAAKDWCVCSKGQQFIYGHTSICEYGHWWGISSPIFAFFHLMRSGGARQGISKKSQDFVWNSDKDFCQKFHVGLYGQYTRVLCPRGELNQAVEIVLLHNCKQKCYGLLLITSKHKIKWVRLELAALALRDIDLHHYSPSNIKL